MLLSTAFKCQPKPRPISKPTIRKVEASELGNDQSALILKYGSAGRDLTIPQGSHAWIVSYRGGINGAWNDAYLTRKEARESVRRYKIQLLPSHCLGFRPSQRLRLYAARNVRFALGYPPSPQASKARPNPF